MKLYVCVCVLSIHCLTIGLFLVWGSFNKVTIIVSIWLVLFFVCFFIYMLGLILSILAALQFVATDVSLKKIDLIASEILEIKRKEFESVVVRWMSLEPVKKSEVSQKD